MLYQHYSKSKRAIWRNLNESLRRTKMDGGKQIEDALIAVQETDRYYGECNTRFHLKPLTPENDTRTGSKLRKIDVNVESPY